MKRVTIKTALILGKLNLTPDVDAATEFNSTINSQSSFDLINLLDSAVLVSTTDSEISNYHKVK